MKKWLQLFLAIVLMTPAAACRKDNNELDPTKQYSIKVLVQDELLFTQNYVAPIMSKHPNVDLNLITFDMKPPADLDKFKRVLTDEQPDLIAFSGNVYYDQLNDGTLMDLGELMKRDRFGDDLYKPVLDVLKDNENDQLFGLSPGFNSYAIYYNKDIFDRLGVPIPQEGMTWDELFHLSEQITNASKAFGEPIYGLSFEIPSLTGILTVIGQFGGLSMVDASGKTVVIDSPAWRPVIAKLVNGVRNGSIGYRKSAGESNPLASDLFLTGKSAMALRHYGFHHNVELYEKTQQKTPLAEQWDVVTVPGREGDSLQGPISVAEIFSIPTTSPNPEVAWALIKDIHGKEFALLRSKLPTGDLPSVTNVVNEVQGRSTAPFYRFTSAVTRNRNMPEGAALDVAGDPYLTTVIEQGLPEDTYIPELKKLLQDQLDLAHLSK